MRTNSMGKHGARRRFSSRKCTILIAFGVIGYTFITLYTLFSLWPHNHNDLIDDTSQKRKQLALSSRPSENVTIEVWGKAAIGLYFWEHILKGPLVPKLGGVWTYGEKSIESLRFKFRTGPGVVPHKVPKDTKHLVLILNGRENEKVNFAQAWLDSLGNFKMLKNVAIVILGNEQCENDWLLNYVAMSRGIIKAVFIVYDITNSYNGLFHQWPLGVATYRKFPLIMPLSVNVQQRRKYRCNFLGTVHSGSSRELLKKVIDSWDFYKDCFVKYRKTWLPNENKETSRQYHYALANSDLTLCPVGFNTECYRIYEACSYGSVPVVEDVATPGQCNKDSPLALLKKYKAPFIFVKNWTELPRVLERERHMSDAELADRRRMIISWYTKFKEQMRLHFVNTLVRKFEL